MDLKVLLSAYGRSWMISPDHAQGYISLLERMMSRDSSLDIAAELDKPTRTNFYYKVNSQGKTVDGDMMSRTGNVAVIEIIGAVMKYDFCGSPGTQTMGLMVDQANSDPSVSGMILMIDSPGGSVAGTAEFENIIRNSAKPVVAFISDLCCSAAMWPASAAAYRIANSETADIGSIGTMARWYDRSEYLKNQGYVEHEVYATRSTEKNIEFREAMGKNKDGKTNYTPLIVNMLDPVNDAFIARIKENLPGVSEDVFTGAVYVANTAQDKGLIDKIGTFQDAIDKVLELSKKTSKQTGMSQTQTNKYPKTQAAAKAEGLDQMNEGIWLSEEQVGNIEASITENETALQTATGQVTNLTEQLRVANEAKTTAETALSAANTKLEALKGKTIIGADTNTVKDPKQEAKNEDWCEVDMEAQRLRDLAK